MLALKHGGFYDPQRTHAYLFAMTESQLAAHTDGRGSATGAVAFGVREFARQDNREWQLVWRHGASGPTSRPEHLAADGLTIPADGDFGVSPGIGSPGCNCVIEAVLA